MAVESTPERSFSDLLSSSRAAEATTECGRESIVLGLGQPHDVVSFSFCWRRLPNEANGPKRREAKELFRQLRRPVERPLLGGCNREGGWIQHVSRLIEHRPQPVLFDCRSSDEYTIAARSDDNVKSFSSGAPVTTSRDGLHGCDIVRHAEDSR